MPSLKNVRLPQIAEIVLVVVGIVLLLISSFDASSYLAIFGTAVIFWGVILFYISPSRTVPLTFVDAIVTSQFDNLERILLEFNSSEKGLYIPPKNLKNIESSLIFLPKKPQTSIPAMVDEGNGQLYSQHKDGLFLTPPGRGLSQLLEKAVAMSFTKIDLVSLKQTLPKTLIDDLALAQNIEISSEDDKVVVTLAGNVLSEICEQANSCPHTHNQVGCTLSSALACILAKVVGKPIVIHHEITDSRTKTSIMTFLIIDTP
ncbi:MAG: hypothetical protein NWF04_03875 [Candidatus Bathyarchaeota archaeon]|nr:hypothetical protein [Candidatus Bathyarchaeota archaeon]